MNRIILIGNGFDLAHGLPTRYEDFINWYWERWGRILSQSNKRNEADVFCLSHFIIKKRMAQTIIWNLCRIFVEILLI